jgi:repressor of nif and glnA expression
LDAKKERYRRIRGVILKLLACEHPRPMDSKVVHVLLDDLRYPITEEECESHLVYLAEKGLINKETRKSSGMNLVMVTISPRGLDLLDGFIGDVGVDVRF